MNLFKNRSLYPSIVVFSSVYSFGNITRDSFFVNPEGTSTDGSFLSGFIFPFKFSHSKVHSSQDSIAGIILQFKDKSHKGKDYPQDNKWILRFPSENNEIYQLTGKFNFDVGSNSILNVNLKELSGIKINGNKVCSHSSPLMRIPILKDFVKETVKANAFLDVKQGFFDKHIILFNRNKKKEYMDGAEINILKIKELLSKRKETVGYRLPDETKEYVVGIIEPPEKLTLEPQPKSESSKKYIIEEVDFVYLRYNPGVSSSHNRY